MSTYVKVEILSKSGKLIKPLRTDDFSDIFAGSSSVSQIMNKVKNNPPGNDWTDAYALIDENKKIMVFNGSALWFDWKTIQRKIASWEERKWTVIVR